MPADARIGFEKPTEILHQALASLASLFSKEQLGEAIESLGNSKVDWTEETINNLRTLWDAGHSTGEIGRRMRITKNAVVGKAHRLQLTSRPSPIRRTGGPARKKAPDKVDEKAKLRIVDTSGVTPADAGGQPPPPAAPVLARVVGRPLPSIPGGRTLPCCWPIGEPGHPSFRFCDEVAMWGKPYCEAHAQLAYVKVRDRREDAA